jgi:hypothetical protein
MGHLPRLLVYRLTDDLRQRMLCIRAPFVFLLPRIHLPLCAWRDAQLHVLTSDEPLIPGYV